MGELEENDVSSVMPRAAERIQSEAAPTRIQKDN